MRIGLLAPPWISVPPDSYGGTEAVLDTLAQGLRAAGHEPVLFTVGTSTCDVERRWLFDDPPEPEPWTTVALMRHVQAGYAALADCDVIHDHTELGPVWAAARRCAQPVVATFHGNFTEQSRPVWTDVVRWVTPTAISRSQRSQVPELGIEHVVHHGIDVGRFPDGSGDGGYALFVGRLSPDKGVHEAIEIARRAGVPLRIAAKMRDPEERAYYAAEVEPRLGADVEYVGEVSPSERNRLCASAIALVNPIRWPEPFGMVMVEALACGTPVVAYPQGAAPEIVEQGRSGFLAATQDQAVEALRHVEVIDRAACRASVQRRFSVERMVEGYLTVYRAVTAPRLRRIQ